MRGHPWRGTGLVQVQRLELAACKTLETAHFHTFLPVRAPSDSKSCDDVDSHTVLSLIQNLGEKQIGRDALLRALSLVQ